MKFTALIIIFFLSVNVIAQSYDDSVFVLPKLKIYDKKDYLSFEKFEYNKFILSDSLLTADPKRYLYTIKINDIKKISFQSGGDFWGGAKIGAIAGFALGFAAFGFWDLSDNPKWHAERAFFGGVMLAVPFGIVGGIVGLLGRNYDDYEVWKISKEKKNKYLQSVFRKKEVRK